MIGILFSSLVILLEAVLLTAVYRKRAHFGSRGLAVFSAVTMGWLALTAILGATGALQNYDSFPPPAARIMLPGILLTILLVSSKVGDRIASSSSYAGLIAIQVFRLPLELLLHALHVEGKIPVEMTFGGWNFDILTGLSAVVIAYLLHRGIAGRRTVMVWNIAGLALLVNVVSIAIMSMPGRFNLLRTAVPNVLIFSFPYVWITFFVLVALGGHLVLFRKLRAEQRIPETAPLLV